MRLAIKFVCTVVVIALAVQFFLLVYHAVPEVFVWGPGLTVNETFGAIALGLFVLCAVLLKARFTSRRA